MERADGSSGARDLDDRALLFQAVIDSTTEAIFAKDLDGRYLVANRQAAFNMTGDAGFDMVGRTDEEIVGTEIAAWIRKNDQSVLADDCEQRIEEELELPDGPHTFVTAKAPFRNADGEQAGLVGVARDITAEKMLAAERGRLHEMEHRLAVTVQEALLGRFELQDDRLDVCGRYRPAVDGIAVGGDWHDALALPHGGVGLFVGDAVGHGIDAVAVMGQLRSALLGLALAGLDPGEALTALDAYAATLPGAASATCLFVVVDPETQTLTFSCAGHMPPLVLPPDADVATFLDGAQDVPLASTSRPRRRATSRHPFPVGSTLLLYTDGLVERRAESLDVGLARLASGVVSARERPVSDLCDELLASLAEARQRDDLAVIVARLVSTGAPRFRRSIEPEPQAARGLRHAFREWLAQQGLQPEEEAGLELAVGEALANAVEHAYVDSATPGQITVEGQARGGALVITVHDHGAWRPPHEDDTRGRGFMLMRGLADEVDIARDGGGTTVRLVHRRAPAKRAGEWSA